MTRTFKLSYTVEFGDGSRVTHTESGLIGAKYIPHEIQVFYPEKNSMASSAWTIYGNMVEFKLEYEEDIHDLTDV